MNITSKMPRLHPSSSLCILSLFILLIFSLSITGLAYIVAQATAYTNTTGSSLNLLNISLDDSNQNLIAQTATKISCERSEGIGGNLKIPIIDTRSLPPDEANEIQGMIDNAKELIDKNFRQTRPADAGDLFKYKITIQTEEGKQNTTNTIEVYEVGMPPGIQPLLDYLKPRLKSC
jgi:hypothetical protein